MSQDIILSPSTRPLRCSLLVLPLEARRQIYKFALAQMSLFAYLSGLFQRDRCANGARSVF
jgi:hypothetical protein